MPTSLSVVVPVYCCKACIGELTTRVRTSLEARGVADFEIILVNDGSPDDCWADIVRLGNSDARVKGLDLSRNFGQHAAISAGLQASTGDWVVLMDCDLQDPPEAIPLLLDAVRSGFDIALARRLHRQDGWAKALFGTLYYRLLSYMTGTHIDPSVGTFRVLSRRVVNSFNRMGERTRFFGAMINWLGFSVTYVDVEHAARKHGSSSYSFWKLIRLGMDGILSFSDKPLRLTVALGLAMILSSGSYVGYLVLRNVLYGTEAVGWNSLIATIFLSTGITISVLGVTGIYVGKIFEESKGRPLYLVKRESNLPEEKE